VNTVDFDSAVKTINKLLRKNQPNIFNSSWIRRHAPHIYRFFQKNVRRETGGIDWDRITRALDRKFQRKWITSRHKGTKLSRNKTDLNIIVRKYEAKLYTLLLMDKLFFYWLNEQVLYILLQLLKVTEFFSLNYDHYNLPYI
jgi:hypothetical protein